MSNFLHTNNDNNDDAKAIAIPRVFSENSQSKKGPSDTSKLLLVYRK